MKSFRIHVDPEKEEDLKLIQIGKYFSRNNLTCKIILGCQMQYVNVTRYMDITCINFMINLELECWGLYLNLASDMFSVTP